MRERRNERGGTREGKRDREGKREGGQEKGGLRERERWVEIRGNKKETWMERKKEIEGVESERENKGRWKPIKQFY